MALRFLAIAADARDLRRECAYADPRQLLPDLFRGSLVSQLAFKLCKLLFQGIEFAPCTA
jgi:hypothetical protein